MYPVVIVTLIDLFNMAVFAWVIMGLLIYFNIVNAHQPVVRKVNDALNRLIEPVLKPIRRFMPDLGGLDISPVILIVLLTFLRDVVITYGYRL